MTGKPALWYMMKVSGIWIRQDNVLLLLILLIFMNKAQGEYDEACESPQNGSKTCYKGQKLDDNERCKVCPHGQYQDDISHACRECKNCTKCTDGKISKHHPELCPPDEDTTCVARNDSTSQGPDVTTASTVEGLLSTDRVTTSDKSEGSMEGTGQMTTKPVTKPDGPPLDASSKDDDEKTNWKLIAHISMVLAGVFLIWAVTVAIIHWKPEWKQTVIIKLCGKNPHHEMENGQANHQNSNGHVVTFRNDPGQTETGDGDTKMEINDRLLTHGLA